MRVRNIVVALIVAAATLQGVSTSAADEVFMVHMAVGGTGTGLTPQSPVGTLEEAEAVIRQENPDSDVEVHIAPGTYVEGESIWKTYLYGHSISFVPAGYQIGDARPSQVPRFESDGSIGYWFRAQLESNDQGGTTALQFYYLTVTGYANGLIIQGPTQSATGIRGPARLGMNGNTFYGMRFEKIGSAHNSTMSGFGALTLQNSDDNWVRNNHFVEIENVQAEVQRLHAIYMAHGADNNEIVFNRFSEANGSPIRVRSQSDGNNIHQNTFTNTGTYPIGFYSEWFCGEDCQAAYGEVLECSSHGNVFHNNTLGSAYTGGYLPMFHRQPDDMTELGPEGCPRDSRPWLQTYDNVRP